MFDTDLSRIGEHFYKEVGREASKSDLADFIKAAFSLYSERYAITGQSFPTKAISFSGGKKHKLYFLFNPVKNSFDLSELKISSETRDFNALLKVLRGNLTAEFTDLKLDDLKDKAEIEKTRIENYAQLGLLGFYFSPKPSFIKEVKLEKLEGLLRKTKTPIKIEDANLGDETVNLFSNADRICVANPQYTNNDPKKELILESFEIIQPEKGRYVFTYNINSATNEGLPSYLLEYWNKIFNQIKDNFGEESFKKVKIGNREEVFCEVNTNEFF